MRPSPTNATAVTARSARRDEGAGLVELARQLPAEHAGQPFGDRDQCAEGDARLAAEPMEEVDEILRRDVAGRRGCERTAAEPADRGVEEGCARLDSGIGIGIAGVARVVEMQ